MTSFSDFMSTIWDGLWEFLYFILDFFFGWVNLPQFPEELQNSINSFMDLIFNNLKFLSFFVRKETLNILIPLTITVFVFKYSYKLVMWGIKKIAMLGVS